MSTHVYILHGWTYSTDKWLPFLDLLKEHGIEATLLPIPGLTKPLEKAWTMKQYVQWLQRILKDESDVILLGHSNGGRISLAYAREYPEKIRHLFLLDSAGVYHNDLALRLKRGIFKGIAKVGKQLIRHPLPRKMLYKLTREQDYHDAPPVAREIMKNMILSDKQEHFRHVTVPTSLIWGRNDQQTPLADGLKMYAIIPKSLMHIIDGARHSPQFTHAQQVRDIVVKTLRKR